MKERRSAEIKIELDAATNKVQALLQERRQIADRDREISNLLEDMGAGFNRSNRSGVIPRLERELERALRLEADANLMKVRIINCIGSDEHVLVKVTEKRIYTRLPGREKSVVWKLDGTSTLTYTSDRIHPKDVEAIHKQRGTR